MSAPVLWLPDVDFEPLQLPEALHDVALVDDHVSVLLPPLVMLVGDAENETVGAAAAIETVALACAVPPDPVQLNVKVRETVRAPVLWLPDVAFDPLQPPDAVHDVALVDDQLSVLLPPLTTDVGEAAMDTVGVGVELRIETVVLAVAVVPPEPLQVNVYVVADVSAPVLAVPDVPLLPLHPPDAVHDVAFVDDHDSVLELPL
ncbi:MAG TPA: hypothetical protein VJN68_11565 [Burkholderiaceae bacterium]|nr:hypothetical protein [Burkholderiaceae bacterium]